jgi:enterochelin esterase family protein
MRPIFSVFVICFAVGIFGAETNRIVSPEVHVDRTVTFRLQATNAAQASVTADWMEPGTSARMSRDEAGVWTATVGPVDPGIYIYTFGVDGMTIADPVNPQIKLRARTSASLLEVHGASPQLWEPRPDVPRGTIEIQNHVATALDYEMRQVWIYKPPGYERHPFRRYPVLYLLHGSNDTPAGWTMVGRANYIMDNLLADKKAREMIIVMPFGHAVHFDAPREQQMKNSDRFEEYFFKDLVPLVERNYRVKKGRENTAIVGLSMGGGQSLQIGLGHLDHFSAIGAFSSAIPRDFENRFSDLLAHPDATNKKLKLLWIGCGRQDSAFQGCQKLSAVLEKHQIHHTFNPTEGRHTYTVWREYFTDVAPLLFR